MKTKYGYVYKTRNEITKEVYIGQKCSPEFIPTYLGSGPTIKRNIKEYGRDSFTVKLLKWAKDQEMLNQLEIKYIAKYKDLVGEKCLNQAKGGSGGNVFMYASEEIIEKFKDDMSEVNKKRCGTPEFREKAKQRMIERYQDPEERRKQSERINKAWSNLELRREQSERVKAMWADGRKTKHMSSNRKCVFELGDQISIFLSVNELREYLTEQFNYTPDRRTFSKIINSENPYSPYHKNNKVLSKLKGMRIFYI